MHAEYNDKCFMKPAMHVYCKMFAHGQENVADEEWPGHTVVSMIAAMIAAVDSLIRSKQRWTYMWIQVIHWKKQC